MLIVRPALGSVPSLVGDHLPASVLALEDQARRQLHLILIVRAPD
jgi:hypothetical protein